MSQKKNQKYVKDEDKIFDTNVYDSIMNTTSFCDDTVSSNHHRSDTCTPHYIHSHTNILSGKVHNRLASRCHDPGKDCSTNSIEKLIDTLTKVEQLTSIQPPHSARDYLPTGDSRNKLTIDHSCIKGSKGQTRVSNRGLSSINADKMTIESCKEVIGDRRSTGQVMLTQTLKEYAKRMKPSETTHLAEMKLRTKEIVKKGVYNSTTLKTSILGNKPKVQLKDTVQGSIETARVSSSKGSHKCTTSMPKANIDHLLNIDKQSLANSQSNFFARDTAGLLMPSSRSPGIQTSRETTKRKLSLKPGDRKEEVTMKSPALRTIDKSIMDSKKTNTTKKMIKGVINNNNCINSINSINIVNSNKKGHLDTLSPKRTVSPYTDKASVVKSTQCVTSRQVTLFL